MKNSLILFGLMGLFLSLSCTRKKETVVQRVIEREKAPPTPNTPTTPNEPPTPPITTDRPEEMPFETRLKEARANNCLGDKERLPALYGAIRKGTPLSVDSVLLGKLLKGNLQRSHFAKGAREKELFAGISDEKDLLVVSRLYEDEGEEEYYNLTLHLCGESSDVFTRFDLPSQGILLKELEDCGSGEVDSRTLKVTAVPGQNTRSRIMDFENVPQCHY